MPHEVEVQQAQRFQRQQGVQPGFAPDSILQIPNVIKSPNGMSEGTYSKSLPMQSMMRQATGYGTGGNGTMNV